MNCSQIHTKKKNSLKNFHSEQEVQEVTRSKKCFFKCTPEIFVLLIKKKKTICLLNLHNLNELKQHLVEAFSFT